MEDSIELHFERDTDWYDWLLKNHTKEKSVYLIFYKLETNMPTMRWEEAVKVALCFGWIDSKVQSLGEGKRRQYYSPRKANSNWSAVNKKYVAELIAKNLMQDAGFKSIETAKQTGTWTAMDAIEKGIIPDALQQAFDENSIAFANFNNFSKSYRKSYLAYLNSAKREVTQSKRIEEIIALCEANKKMR
ncbi:YdeI/OmpD-associated family protein [Tamlana sp. 2_MG-2023]|uniref:YdeI/OmpD-associated family protein n=1 Tax=unclassified Tamlana TaxID=2614803 RepID=UPI0026E2D2FF|nr:MULTISPECIES: YdeI/OmpD-associated family protein [unclassified Tamlana]MDO6760101.1 YdeI/OmpD-associated family protein [Tamlana sp. 2_MG-2023]MDO6790201.1 YdeI/OmpD-associated family protein [Tamlana sp. 1_MG-2023]